MKKYTYRDAKSRSRKNKATLGLIALSLACLVGIPLGQVPWSALLWVVGGFLAIKLIWR